MRQIFEKIILIVFIVSLLRAMPVLYATTFPSPPSVPGTSGLDDENNGDDGGNGGGGGGIVTTTTTLKPEGPLFNTTTITTKVGIRDDNILIKDKLTNKTIIEFSKNITKNAYQDVVVKKQNIASKIGYVDIANIILQENQRKTFYVDRLKDYQHVCVIENTSAEITKHIKNSCEGHVLLNCNEQTTGMSCSIIDNRYKISGSENTAAWELNITISSTTTTTTTMLEHDKEEEKKGTQKSTEETRIELIIVLLLVILTPGFFIVNYRRKKKKISEIAKKIEKERKGNRA